MIYVKINGVLYPARVDGRVSDRDWDGRESKSITLSMTHEEASQTFVSGLGWSIVNKPAEYIDESGKTITPDPVEYDNSEYCIAGEITDHRDGTLTVKMGKLTELEETLEVIYGGAE